MVDLIAMTLSKTDYSISATYESQLVKSDDHTLLDLGNEIRSELVRTRKAILEVTGCSDLSNGFQLLKRSMKVRNPYVDPLNVMQAEMMKRLRSVSLQESAATASERMSTSSEEDPNVINADIKLRQEAEERGCVEDTLIVSINGIAQGMKNSG